MIPSKRTFILFFIAVGQLSQLHSMQYVKDAAKNMAYKIIPDAYNATLNLNLNANPETLKTLDKLGEDVRKGTNVASGAVIEGTKNLSQAITTSTSTIGQTITSTAQRICDTVDNGTKTFEKTADQLRRTTEKASGDMIKSIDTINGTANRFLDTGIQISVDSQTTQAIRDLTNTVKPFAENGVQISIDPKTTDTLAQAVTTFKPIIDNGLQIKVDDQTSKALQELAVNGVQTKLSIDPKTIIASCTALGGLTLVAVGAVLIYNELTKPEDLNLKVTSSEELTWKNSFKSILKNRYVIGTTSIISGLLLIVNSNRIAMACV